MIAIVNNKEYNSVVKITNTKAFFKYSECLFLVDDLEKMTEQAQMQLIGEVEDVRKRIDVMLALHKNLFELIDILFMESDSVEIKNYVDKDINNMVEVFRAIVDEGITNTNDINIDKGNINN